MWGRIQRRPGPHAGRTSLQSRLIATVLPGRTPTSYPPRDGVQKAAQRGQGHRAEPRLLAAESSPGLRPPTRRPWGLMAALGLRPLCRGRGGGAQASHHCVQSTVLQLQCVGACPCKADRGDCVRTSALVPHLFVASVKSASLNGMLGVSEDERQGVTNTIVRPRERGTPVPFYLSLRGVHSCLHPQACRVPRLVSQPQGAPEVS